MSVGTPFTPAEDEQLRLGWDCGMSASAIARQLAPRTKNMVIGRARRIGLPPRISPIVRAGGAQPPVGGSPVGGSPVGGSPVGGSPVGGSPVGGSPVGESRREKAARRKEQREAAEGVTLVAATSAVVVTPPVVRFSRRTECQWPIGEPGTRGFRFCGEPAQAGKPYCLSHCRIAFVRVEQRREETIA